jgi:hypothetical protein
VRALVDALVWDGEHGDITLGLVCGPGDEHWTVASSRGESLSLGARGEDAWREGNITLLDDRLRHGDSSGHRGRDERGWQGEMTFAIGGAGLAIVGRDPDVAKARQGRAFQLDEPTVNLVGFS